MGKVSKRVALPFGRLVLHGAMHINMHVVFLNTRAEVKWDFHFMVCPRQWAWHTGPHMQVPGGAGVAVGCANTSTDRTT